MKTLRGYQALEVAKVHEGLVEVSYKESNEDDACYGFYKDALEMISNGHKIEGFYLENWPDNDEEADAIVLNAYKNALIKAGWDWTEIYDMCAYTHPLHPDAGLISARRLASQGLLMESHDAFCIKPTFDIQRIINEPGLLCDECRSLNESIHEECAKKLATAIVWALSPVTGSNGTRKQDDLSRIAHGLTSLGVSIWDSLSPKEDEK